MKLNKVIFPAPQPSYNSDRFLGEIIYIPRNQLTGGSAGDIDKATKTYAYYKAASSNQNRSNHIPCLFLPYTSGSSKLLVYFHGNAEDIGLSYEMLDHLRSSLKINILAMEYPGYGIYKESGGCSSEKIIEDCEYIYKYVQQETGIKEKDMIIFGRSMGSGPATYISANYKPGALILMSPYTSIKNVVKSKVSWLSFLVAKHFDNKKLMKSVTSPTFIVHGQKDTLIPYDHAQKLHDRCQGFASLLLPPEMTHNDFDFYQDLIIPMLKFLREIKLNTGPTKRVQKVQFQESLYIPPEDSEKQKQLQSFMGQSKSQSVYAKRQMTQSNDSNKEVVQKANRRSTLIVEGEELQEYQSQQKVRSKHKQEEEKENGAQSHKQPRQSQIKK